MPNNIFYGTASAVAQVDRFTPANVEIGDIFTLTATAEDGTTTAAVSFVATAGTVANVTAGLTAAWNASTSALHTGITAADATTSMTLTADTAGVPFYVASTTTDGGGTNNQTLTRAVVTANSGPYDYKTAANWSLAAVPVANDTVYIDPSAGDILYGLDNSTVEIDGFYRPLAHAGDIGDGTYYLYLDVENSKPIEIDYHYGPTISAPTRRTMVKVKDAAIVTVYNVPTSVTGESGKPPTRLLFNSASAALHVLGGTGQVGVAVNVAGESSTIGTVHVASTAASVWIGSGVTLTTLSVLGGAVVCQSAPTTFTNNGGTVTLNCSGTITNFTTRGGTTTTLGSVAVTNFTIQGGTVYSNSSGTITTGALDGGVLDFTTSSTARTVTSLQSTLHSIYGPAVLKIDDSIVTLTGKHDPTGRFVLTTAA